MNPRTIVAIYVVIFIMTALVLIVRGPIRDAVWAEPCRDIRAGEPIPGHWNTIEPCRQAG